jgi:4-hydroxy-tetrahydrodipicolinate synthase
MGTMPGGEIPWAIIKLWDCLESNDLELAQSIHDLISQLVAFQQNIDGYVAVEKYLLVKQGIFDSTRQRGPVRTILSSQVKNDIDQIFEKLVKVVNN